MARFRAGLERLGLCYMLAVPCFLAALLTADGPSLSLAMIANGLPASAWRQIRWGHDRHLVARFAAAHDAAAATAGWFAKSRARAANGSPTSATSRRPRRSGASR